MISIEQYRAAIGLFHGAVGRRGFKSEMYFWSFIFPNFFFYNWVLPSLLLKCGDIEENPGPTSPHQNDTSIHIGHVNIWSLMAPVKDQPNLKKFDLVKNHISFHKYHIFGISETWLNKSDKNEDLYIPGYSLPIRRDVGGHQGGVLVYIADNVTALRKPDIEPPNSQIICIELQLHNSKILICNCYRPPHDDIIDFCDMLDDIMTTTSGQYQNYIIMGDTNARNKEFWDEDKTTTEGRILKAWLDSSNLEQLIHEPTRIMNDSRSCIDHICTSNPYIISEAGVRPKIASDHHPIFAVLKSKCPRPQAFKRMVWDYKRGDYDTFRKKLLDAPWYMCYNSNDIDVIVDNWIKMFISIAETCIPHYETVIRPCDKNFMNSDLREMMRKRDRLFELSKQSNNDNLKERYRILRNKIVSECRNAKAKQEQKENDTISNVDTANKQWWSLYKEMINKGKNSSVGPLMDGDKLITDDIQRANLLNTFFTDQTCLDDSHAWLPPETQNPLVIDQKITDAVEIYGILIHLDTSKATGPDGISNRLLKEASVSIAEPLSRLFNYSLSIGRFPDVWKIANVIPVFKKGDPLMCNNYRPISLLCCISKVFEKIIFNHIYPYLKKNKLIHIRQSGFTHGDSTVNQLIAICNLIHCNLDNGDEILSVFLDLTKAFDKVWHKGLLYKIRRCGINGNLYKWIESYLSDRKQRVVINGASSETRNIMAGVPQGSVLGPLLFLIYINDICDNLTSEAFLFADDTSIFCPLGNNPINTANIINRDLERIYQWSCHWLVSLNPTKTVYMLFSTKRTPSNIPPLYIGNVPLEMVDSHKHLGLILTPTLSWTKHIDALIAKVNKRLGMLKRYKYRFSRNALEIGYKTFVRPILEYGNIVYDSCLKEESDRIENVQLEAARIVTGGKFRTSSEELYEELGWRDLSTRRKISKLTRFHSFCTGKCPDYINQILQGFRYDSARTTRGSETGLIPVPKCTRESYRNAYFPSTIRAWNSLSPALRGAPSCTSFKRQLHEIHKCKSRLFYHDVPRRIQVSYTQLRMGFSNLNYDLAIRGCTDDMSCVCGHKKEDAKHFLLECKLYHEERMVMFNGIADTVNTQNLKTTTLLYGKEAFSIDVNNNIMKSVCEFIASTGRLL